MLDLRKANATGMDFIYSAGKLYHSIIFHGNKLVIVNAYNFK